MTKGNKFAADAVKPDITDGTNIISATVLFVIKELNSELKNRQSVPVLTEYNNGKRDS